MIIDFMAFTLIHASCNQPQILGFRFTLKPILKFVIGS